MAYWLVKSEPEAWSWQQQEAAGTTCWDGVRNAQANNNLKAMQVGDQAYFYHSGAERAIVGVVEVVRTYYPDPTDASGRFGMVDVRMVAPLPRPVTLASIKAEEGLAHLALVRQSRLSVMPVDPQAWQVIASMGALAR
ncbi:MAG: EVE domain-containing protein [Defluviicoccus sp.]|nr:EVE domain-containing protein [Defluviicoccus sp.]MDG4593749.1 EVE domain-containing protein [Defluviicoccus sp.]MDS4012044.1 EVE domain-containing protein [Defluviicoccus sp.]